MYRLHACGSSPDGATRDRIPSPSPFSFSRGGFSKTLLPSFPFPFPSYPSPSLCTYSFCLLSNRSVLHLFPLSPFPLPSLRLSPSSLRPLFYSPIAFPPTPFSSSPFSLPVLLLFLSPPLPTLSPSPSSPFYLPPSLICELKWGGHIKVLCGNMSQPKTYCVDKGKQKPWRFGTTWSPLQTAIPKIIPQFRPLWRII